MTDGLKSIRLCIPNEDHTLGCLLRHNLFNNGGEFVACTVPHPQDTRLHVTIQAKDPKRCLLLAIDDARIAMECLLERVDRHSAVMSLG